MNKDIIGKVIYLWLIEEIKIAIRLKEPAYKVAKNNSRSEHGRILETRK